MKLLDFKLPSWITRIWNPSPPSSFRRNVESPHERINRLFPEQPKKKEEEETVILLGDHSHDFDPPA